MIEGIPSPVSYVPMQIDQVKVSILFTRGVGDTSYNGVYGEAPPKRGTFFMLQLYKKSKDFTNLRRYMQG